MCVSVKYYTIVVTTCYYFFTTFYCIVTSIYSLTAFVRLFTTFLPCKKCLKKLPLNYHKLLQITTRFTIANILTAKNSGFFSIKMLLRFTTFD